MRMVTHQGWEYQPEKCAVDDEFLEFFKTEGHSGRHIFHMGSGLHHKVGRELSGKNSVVSITISPEEMSSYMEMVINEPQKSWSYQLLFADIHAFNPERLEMLDIVTLFHLGEYAKQEELLQRSDYAPLTLFEVARQYMKRLKPGGLLIGYKGSNSWQEAYQAISAAAEVVGLRWKYDHKSLRIWQLPV